MASRQGFLPRISVARPVTVVMLLTGILVVGFIAYTQIQIQFFPSGMENLRMHVWIPFPGATPHEVEQQLAAPVSEMMRTVKGLVRLTMYCTTSGLSCHLSFRNGTDMELAYNHLVDRLERLKPTLPGGVKKDNIGVWKWSGSEDWAIIWAGVSLNPDIQDTYRFMETHLARPLQRIDGVAKVDIRGTYRKSVVIELDQERARARGVNPYDLVEALRGDNFSIASGSIREGGRKFYVRSLAHYRDIEEIEDVRVGKGGNVRLREVANVFYDVPERGWRWQIDGQRAASLGIYRESGTNIVALCREIERTIREEIEKRPGMAGTTVELFFNQGKIIEESMENVEEAAVWGGIFAALVLFFFLRAIRMTLIVTLSIPLCALIAISSLYFMDWSLNVLTMMGLMLGIGIVVDDAIVIVENIYRQRLGGKESRLAAVEGAGEVGIAVVLSTLATVVVFLPLIFMSDDAGFTFVMSRMGVPMIIAIMASLLVSLLFIPLAASRTKQEEVGREPRSVAWMGRAYERVSRWAMEHRLDVFLIALILYASIQFPAAHVKQKGSSGGPRRDVGMSFDMPTNFSLNETSGVIAEVERFMEEKREAYGIRKISSWYWKNGGGVRIILNTERNPWWHIAYKKLREILGIPVFAMMPRKEIMDDIAKEIPKFVGVRFRIWGGEGWGGAGPDAQMSVFIYGDDTEVLANLSEEVERRLKTIPEIINLDPDRNRGEDEIRIRIDREQARKLGITPRRVGHTISAGLQGVTLPRFRAGDREVDVRLSLQESQRATLEQLKNFTFTSREGQEIPLKAIASTSIHRGSENITRYFTGVRQDIRVITTKDDLKTLYQKIDRAMEGFEMPRGYRWDKGEGYRRLEETAETQKYAILLAVVFVLLLMGGLFESFVLPFSVLLSIPFSFLGVYWTLYLTDTPFDQTATIGSVILIGVVVKNGIVLIDRINQLRVEGMSRTEAIVIGGRQRLRPIFMTTATTVFAWLPMAMGAGSMLGTSYAPMGRAMMGGMVVSTFFTLLVVPLFYTFFDDLREIFRRAAASFQGKGRETIPVAR